MNVFHRKLQQDTEPTHQPRDWWSASGTGWGEQGDQPNPFARVWERLKRDTQETVGDLRDEPEEVPYRLRQRLDAYIKGVYQ